MNPSSLVTFDENGQPLSRQILDLDYSWLVKEYGDITAHVTWTLTDGEGCIVLMRTHRRANSTNTTPCVIASSSIWRWTEEIGDKNHARTMAATFAKAMGYNSHDVGKVSKILTIVRNHIEDVIMTPPIPAERMKHRADIVRTDESGKETYLKVMDHV